LRPNLNFDVQDSGVSFFLENRFRHSLTGPKMHSLKSSVGKQQARFAPTAWEVRCLAVQAGKQAQCTLRRAIVELRTRQTLLGISLSGDRKRLELLLPHGLDLRQPTEVLVDGKVLGKASYITSRSHGLFARMPVQSAHLKRMAAGKQLAVRARVLNGKPLVIRTRLEGFASALAKLR